VHTPWIYAPTVVTLPVSGITVVPKGSVWAQNPIPDPEYDKNPGTFAPRCKKSKDRKCACNVYEGGCSLDIVDQVCAHTMLHSFLDSRLKLSQPRR
jgi:hypothetical protein